IDSDHVPANEGLARLLGICGRRHEAIPYVLKLIQQEHATDLVILLSRSGGMIDEPDLLRSAHRRSPEDPLPLVGLARLESNRGNLEAALELTEESLRLSADVEEAYVLKAEILMSQQRIPQASRWMRTLPDSVSDRPEIWLIRAQLADHFQDVDGAIRAYWEAAKRQPEHRTPPARLAELLSTRGLVEQAEQFSQRLNQILKLEQKFDAMLQSRHQSITPLLEVVEACASAGRLWEAYAYVRLAVELDSSNEVLARRALELREQLIALPLRQTADAANVAVSIDLSDYPEPRLHPGRESIPREPIASIRKIRFREEATEVGLIFHYNRGTNGPPRRLMYEFTGGGIAAIDYDLDGWPDLFFTQGTDWPPETFVGNDSDRIFRNRFGEQFEEITAHTGIAETKFGQGAAVGDYD
ncbi:MAG TPA: tetratricopeptide repeat protein, partial [Planctomycetaceae bacterium]|nr:tetratricopeptide repeat protein [Planctomycetaceae bacterium]